MPDSYIHVEDLCKHFVVRLKREKGTLLRRKNRIQALRGVSFDVNRGELVGYIGPNGAGKSTTVKILSGILTPDQGEVLVGGRVPWKERKAHVRHIGVVFGQRMQLWWDVPIMDSYALLRDIYRIPEHDYRTRLEELTEELNLKELLSTPLRQLSLGQRMRAELCGSLLHQPELLFLDEPTIGLDAVSKLALRNFLLRENRIHQTTILLTTHDRAYNAYQNKRGQKLYDGRLPELLQKYDTLRTVTVRYEKAPAPFSLPPSVQPRQEAETLYLSYENSSTNIDELLPLLQQAGTIRELTVQPQNIDHLIADMYREMGL